MLIGPDLISHCDLLPPWPTQAAVLPLPDLPDEPLPRTGNGAGFLCVVSSGAAALSEWDASSEWEMLVA